jgi:hypothetical protein
MAATTTSSSSSTSLYMPPHHYHVRTKGWGIEPGWKLVSHSIEQDTKYPKVIDVGNRRSSSSTGLRERTNGIGRDRFTHFENGIGRIKPPPPVTTSTSSLHSSASKSRIGASKEDICPIHNHHVPTAAAATGLTSNAHWFASVGRNAGERYRSAGYVTTGRPSIFQTNLSIGSSSSISNRIIGSSSLDHRRYSPPPSSGASNASSTGSSEASVCPPGVLKKPGSNRGGPKHMKKVAFLENAEFSRGIP